MNAQTGALVLCIATLAITASFSACSESSNSTSDPTASTGGSGGTSPLDGSAESGKKDGSAGSGGVIGSGGNSSKGGSGGSLFSDAGFFDVFIADSAWLDGTWDGFLPTCGSENDAGEKDSNAPDTSKPESGVADSGDTKSDTDGAPQPHGAACFSGDSYWKMDNYNPCIWGTDPYGSEGAMSTIPVASADGGLSYKCDYSAKPMADPPVLPSAPWAHVWIKALCPGVYKLCYELKAGDPYHPSSIDCTLGKVCTEGAYQEPNTEQSMPDMPAWTSKEANCAQTFFNAGGYGLLWIAGVSTACDVVPDHVIGALPYCPPKCGLAANQNLPECKSCHF